MGFGYGSGQEQGSRLYWLKC